MFITTFQRKFIKGRKDMDDDQKYKAMSDHKHKVGLSVEQRIAGTRLICWLGALVLLMSFFEKVI